jgi:thioredoxin reductase
MLLVSSDMPVLAALEADLGRRFGNDTRSIGTDGPAAALRRLAALAERAEPVGYILTGNDVETAGERPMLLETSVAGVFAAGDVRHASVRRVTTAMGEGATVVQLLHQRLED